MLVADTLHILARVIAQGVYQDSMNGKFRGVAVKRVRATTLRDVALEEFNRDVLTCVQREIGS